MRHPLKDWGLLLATAALCGLSLLLVSCSSTRDTTTKEVQVEQTVTRTGPVIADTPVGQITIQPATVQIDRRQTTKTDERSHEESQPSIPPNLAAPASGLLGLVPGVGGLLAAGVALWSRQKALGALKACTDGIESWKQEADNKQVEHLHGCLSRKMDASHKAIVRKVKA